MNSNPPTENEQRLASIKENIAAETERLDDLNKELDRIHKICKEADFWALPYPYECYARCHGHESVRAEELGQQLTRLRAEGSRLQEAIAAEKRAQRHAAKRRKTKR